MAKRTLPEQAALEYVEFKIKQYIRINGVNTKGMTREQLADLTRPYLKQWVSEYANS